VEIFGYILFAGWMVGLCLAVLGLGVVLLSGPVLRWLRRVMGGEAGAPPGRGYRVLLWMGRGVGSVCLVLGLFLAFVFWPHMGAGWDAATPRFVSAQDDAALREIVVKAVKPLADDGAVVGLTVGVIDGDKRAVYGFGRKSLKDGAAPDGDTVFEIGSITKVFTSLVMASLVEEGTLRLDQPVQELLGDRVKVPELGGTPIRLIDLSTHTSGLPRVPEDFYTAGAIWESIIPGNPYAYYDAERLMKSVEKARLVSTPGTRYEYSNFGATLLGHAMELYTGQSYPELVRLRIAEPLGLASTAVTPSAEQAARRVPGYATVIDAGRRFTWEAAAWDFPAGTEGAGALKSTVNDLLRFMEAQMAPPETALGKAIEETQVSRRETGMDGLRMGLGWHVLEGLDVADPVIWHNGGTRGYVSFMGFSQKSRRGVVLLCNCFDAFGRVDGAGLEILGAMKERKR
jgi:CubicO group peptidase (beta-lactamase class C family)